MSGINKVFPYSVLTYLVISFGIITSFPRDISQYTIVIENITNGNSLLESYTDKTDIVTDVPLVTIIPMNDTLFTDNPISVLNDINNDNRIESSTIFDETTTVSGTSLDDNTTESNANLDDNTKISTALNNLLGNSRIKGVTAKCFTDTITYENIERENNANVDVKSTNSATDSVTSVSILENSSLDEKTENDIKENNRFADLMLNETETQAEIIINTTDKAITDASSTDKAVVDASSTDKTINDNSSTDKAITDTSSTHTAITGYTSTKKAMTDNISTDKALFDNSLTDKTITNNSSMDEMHKTSTENIESEEYTTFSSIIRGSTNGGYNIKGKFTNVHTTTKNSVKNDLMKMDTMKSSVNASDLNVTKVDEFENISDKERVHIESEIGNNEKELVAKSDKLKKYTNITHDNTKVKKNESNELESFGDDMLDHKSHMNASINSSSLNHTADIESGDDNSTETFEVQNRTISNLTNDKQMNGSNSMRVDERLSVQPHSFGYEISGAAGTTLFRSESVDERGFMKGSYGYRDNQGLYREVVYEADDNGFRATVRTNEPGTAQLNPANVDMIVEPPPKSILENWQSRRDRTLKTRTIPNLFTTG